MPRVLAFLGAGTAIHRPSTALGHVGLWPARQLLATKQYIRKRETNDEQQYQTEESEDPRPTERRQPRRKAQRKPTTESLKCKSIPEGRSRANGSTSIERPVSRPSDCASEIQAADTGTGSEVETLRKLREEIQEGVRRLGAARLKEYVDTVLYQDKSLI